MLDKLDSLQGHEPTPGYDELNVPEIQKLIADGDEKLATSVRDYERPRKGREGVLHAADSETRPALGVVAAARGGEPDVSVPRVAPAAGLNLSYGNLLLP